MVLSFPCHSSWWCPLRRSLYNSEQQGKGRYPMRTLVWCPRNSLVVYGSLGSPRWVGVNWAQLDCQSTRVFFSLKHLHIVFPLAFQSPAIMKKLGSTNLFSPPTSVKENTFPKVWDSDSWWIWEVSLDVTQVKIFEELRIYLNLY